MTPASTNGRCRNDMANESIAAVILLMGLGISTFIAIVMKCGRLRCWIVGERDGKGEAKETRHVVGRWPERPERTSTVPMPIDRFLFLFVKLGEICCNSRARKEIPSTLFSGRAQSPRARVGETQGEASCVA